MIFKTEKFSPTQPNRLVCGFESEPWSLEGGIEITGGANPATTIDRVVDFTLAVAADHEVLVGQEVFTHRRVDALVVVAVFDISLRSGTTAIHPRARSFSLRKYIYRTAFHTSIDDWKGRSTHRAGTT